MTNNKELESMTKKLNADDEIDLRIFKNFFLRNKILIGSFSFIFFFLASFYSLTIKKTWEGKFQIVLSDENQSKTRSASNSGNRVPPLCVASTRSSVSVFFFQDRYTLTPGFMLPSPASPPPTEYHMRIYNK